MNLITKQLPANELPDKWREGLDQSAYVRVTIEAIDPVSDKAKMSQERLDSLLADLASVGETTDAETMKQAFLSSRADLESRQG